MTITPDQLTHLARLAYLDSKDVARYLQKCNVVINQIQHLHLLDTRNVSPLNHPTSVTQYLRPDDIVVKPCVDALAQSAPEFKDNLYIVPQILKG